MRKLLYIAISLVAVGICFYATLAFFDIWWWIRSGGQEGG